MMRVGPQPKLPSPSTTCRRLLGHGGTIRGKILLAFLAMSIITATLGFFSVRYLEHEGALVERTYDRSLMSINFARAAAADFAGIEASAARRMLTSDAETRRGLDAKLAELETTMDDDLSIAVERAQSERAQKAADKVRAALAQWKDARAQVGTADDLPAKWAALDRQADIVAQQLDLLVNYTAGDGFTYRQLAHATVQADRRISLASTLLALILSGSIAMLLSRRVVLPIRQASEIARRIADGDLEVTVPPGGNDELGTLLSAMETMRGNIKTSMEREVALRRSAQTRLADALENTCEGIVVVDADGRIALANAPASRLIGATSPPLRAGDSSDRLAALLASPDPSTRHDDATVREIEVDDARWLQVSRSPTDDGGSIFVYSDVSLVKAQQAALKTANLWLDTALSNLTQGLCVFDASNRLRVFNRRFCDLFGLPADRVRQGMTLRELAELGFGGSTYGAAIKESFVSRIERRAKEGCAVDTLLRLDRRRMLAISHRPLEEGSWLATYEDVTDRSEAEKRIAHMAQHDSLTGLANRGHFAERVEQALGDVSRGDRFALLCLDLDYFKEVNDTLGHPIGDALLRAIAGRLAGLIRGTDMVARLGGDEFAIIQSRSSEPQDAMLLARRVIAALGEPFEIEGHRISIGVSVGIALAPTDGPTYDLLLKNADLALYRAKADGRNTCRFFERAMDDCQQARRLVELDLREALARDQFEIEYQPVFEIAADRISGFEALIRWRHPTRGLVQPGEFIPIAEETGLITQIGEWVLHRACRDAMNWPADISIAINASAAQLRNNGLRDAVVAALAGSGLAPQRLILELTESVLIANALNARTELDQFKAMGIRIAMDDFGTGYSSLSYLHSFPFDTVKIDKSFIREIVTRPEAAAIVRAVIALCGSLGIRTIAEGIETEGQLAILRTEGCHAAQGYFFSPPIPAAAISALLDTQTSLEKFFASQAA